MSVIVKHRTDLDTVAARVGVKLDPASGRCPPASEAPARATRIPDRRQAGSTGSCWRSPRTCASEGVAVGTSEMLDAFAALEHVPWAEQPTSRRRSPPRSPSRPRTGALFELVFDRFFFRAAEAEAARRKITEARPERRASDGEINLDTLRQQIAAALRDGSDAALRDLARLAIAAFGGARARACWASTCSGSGARSACAPSPSRSSRRTTRAATASRASSCAGSSSICAASSSAT